MITIDHQEPYKDHTFAFALIITWLVLIVGGVGLLWEQESDYKKIYARLGISPLPTTLEHQPAVRNRLDQLSREPCSVDAVLGLVKALEAAGFQESAAPLVALAKQCGRYDLSKLSAEAYSKWSIRRPLEQLIQQGCDREAILNLGKGLQNAGYRRETATVHENFSDHCGGHAPSLRSAANVLLELSDYEEAERLASKLINLEPFYNSGYYLRALARDGAGRQLEKAIDDYLTAIELVGNIDGIVSTPYERMAQLYEKLRRYCDAMVPIDAWVALNPAHDTSQTRSIIGRYMNQGGCATTASGRREHFSIQRPNDVTYLSATINGVQGRFLLDTGATFVSLTNSFAEKAGVEIDQDSVVYLQTANGVTHGKRGRAAKIELRSLLAKDVPIVVKTTEDFGEGIDGLLGMSFLSRFNIKISCKSLEIWTRDLPETHIDRDPACTLPYNR